MNALTPQELPNRLTPRVVYQQAVEVASEVHVNRALSMADREADEGASRPPLPRVGHAPHHVSAARPGHWSSAVAHSADGLKRSVSPPFHNQERLLAVSA